MENEKKFTIMKALEILQEIRYYDSKGNVVYQMDEGEESFYLGKAYREYCPTCITPDNFVKILRLAGKLEYLNVINITNEKRQEKTRYDNNAIIPFFKTKRKMYYETPKISRVIDKALGLK
ncbi:MAG: hypothetical protein IK137_02535 [Bacilli bacterium]|nr:hypothetical protein [Bacilli bacterium]